MCTEVGYSANIEERTCTCRLEQREEKKLCERKRIKNYSNQLTFDEAGLDNMKASGYKYMEIELWIYFCGLLLRCLNKD